VDTTYSNHKCDALDIVANYSGLTLHIPIKWIWERHGT